METWKDANTDNLGPQIVDGQTGVPSPGAKRVCVVQASTIFYDTPATIDKAERLVAEASSLGAQLVVFPEAFLGGYPRGAAFGAVVGSRSVQGREDFLKYYGSAVRVPGPEVDRLSAMAGKYKVHLVVGVVERAGSTLYCTILYFNLHGKYLGKHRKLMPTASERIIWGFGDGSTLPVFDTPVGRVGGLICWENRMPLLRTAMYGKGIEIYCAPTADARPTWQASMTHIAMEGGCFVLSANQFCRRKDYPPAPEYALGGFGEVEPSPESVVCPGGSVILSPTGTVLAGPNFEGETLLIADIGTKSQLVKFLFGAYGISTPKFLPVGTSIDLGVLITIVLVVMGRFCVQSSSTSFDEFCKMTRCGMKVQLDWRPTTSRSCI